jgi:hypothetical protein
MALVRVMRQLASPFQAVTICVSSDPQPLDLGRKKAYDKYDNSKTAFK